MDKAIVVSRVSKFYSSNKEKIVALDDVSLSINSGEIFGLLGPNGAGKTTLISILAGILTPDEGKAEILGLDCTRDTKKMQETINLVSGFTGALFRLSCEEALMYYSLLYNVPNPKNKIKTVLELVHLEHDRNLAVEDFSAGMKQRYLIAKALLNDPKVLILDEPTVGLDVESAINIREIIKCLRKEGRTILLTTHNMFEAEELCDEIAFINHGKILNIGTFAELKEKVVSKRIIEINCSDGSLILKALGNLKGISIFSHSPKLVYMEVDNYERIKDVMKALSKTKSKIFNISVLEPTLEETYLKLIKKGEKHD
ncbi:MAG: ABC transporter ATP-binding protein [Candidatus Micrarchaeota archaeon]